MLKQLLFCSVLLGATCTFATAGVSDEAVKIFGSEEAKERIAKGAVFIDGEFIRAPYSVTREGNVILVNGKIANRFTVEAKAEEPEPEVEEIEESTEPEVEDDSGSDEMPTLDDSDFDTPTTAKKTSEIEKRLASKGGSIDDRLAAKKKRLELKNESKGGFNTGLDENGKKISSYDPEALFEESDYTYTPPSKPEPKAVPYIRPEAQLSAKERAEQAKARDAEIAARGSSDDEPDIGEGGDGSDEIGDVEIAAASEESFEGLSEKEIALYTRRFAARRAAIENALKVNGLVLLSSTTDGVKAEKQNIMRRFMLDLPELCEASSSKPLIDKWGKMLPRAYLQLIYNNRDKNTAASKTLILRIKRETKNEARRSRNRI